MAPSVLFDARLLLRKPTGIGQYIASLVPELVSLAPDWTFHLLRPSEPWSDYRVQEWTSPNLIHHLTRERHMSLVQHVRIPRRAQALGVDLVHYPHIDAPVFFATVPVIATVHGMLSTVHPELRTSLSTGKRAYLRLCTWATLRRAAAVLAVSETCAKEIEMQKGSRERVWVTPLAADSRFRPRDAVDVRRFRSERRLARPFVLSVGEFRPHKNFAGLLAAWASCRSRATHDLLLAGVSHPGSESPEREVERLGLQDGVRLLTDLSRDELVTAYSAAEVVVLPSLYEGFGLPVLEAMACDVAVITSRGTATAEVAGSAACLVDPRDASEIASAIDRLVDSEPDRRRLVERAREWRRQFSWRRTAERTFEAYRRVVEDRA